MGYFQYLRDHVTYANHDQFLSLLDKNKNAKLLDIGCFDGEFTLELADKVNTKRIYGIELLSDAILKARKRGIVVYKSNLNKKFPIKSGTMDIVVSNQVIEHVYNLDNFICELKRVLKPNGYAIIATENLASWHNIFALLFGWQPFSTTNFSSIKQVIGNPLLLGRYTKSLPDTQIHRNVHAYEGLKELFGLYGFKVEKTLGSGWYPLPPGIAKYVCRIDTRHSAFLIFKIRKI